MMGNRMHRAWLPLLLVSIGLSSAACSTTRVAADAHSPQAEAEPVEQPLAGAEASDDPSAAAPSSSAASEGDAEPVSSSGRAPIDLDAADDGLDADIAELSRDTAAASPRKAPEAEQSGQEIVYRVTPKGLVIELDGLHFRPEVKPFKDKQGAYGVELLLTAESFDGRQYWIDAPRTGPLSVAGKIKAKDGKSSRFSDEHEASQEQAILPSQAHRFRQRWPGPGQPKLWSGQTVTLEIGLWGVRTDSGRERPVRRLFVVEMLAGNPARPVISPPTLDWGN
jgi:hypothetical protein